jgi:hypothetical protein
VYLEIPTLQKMDAEMCAVIAQVLPVFWLVVVVPGRGILGVAAPDRRDLMSHIGVVALLGLSEGAALYGPGHGGLNGYLSQLTWGMTFLALALLTVNQIGEFVGKLRQGE